MVKWFFLTLIFLLVMSFTVNRHDRIKIDFISPVVFGLCVDTAIGNIGPIFFPVKNNNRIPIIVKSESFNDRRNNYTIEIPPGKTGVLIGYPLSNKEKLKGPIYFSMKMTITDEHNTIGSIEKVITAKYTFSDYIMKGVSYDFDRSISCIKLDTSFMSNYLKIENTSKMPKSFFLTCRKGYKIFSQCSNNMINDTTNYMQIQGKKSALVQLDKLNASTNDVDLKIFADTMSGTKIVKYIIKYKNY